MGLLWSPVHTVAQTEGLSRGAIWLEGSWKVTCTLKPKHAVPSEISVRSVKKLATSSGEAESDIRHNVSWTEIQLFSQMNGNSVWTDYLNQFLGISLWNGASRGYLYSNMQCRVCGVRKPSWVMKLKKKNSKWCPATLHTSNSIHLLILSLWCVQI